MPNIWDIFAAFGEPVTTGGPALITLLDAAWFTAKEAIAGFVLGAVIGFGIAVVLVHSRLLERGLLPYIVASQTVPILAIAPMVVIGLGSRASRAGRRWRSSPRTSRSSRWRSIRCAACSRPTRGRSS
jgi:NitT/TauT family transport system permease protein